jgi:hypothetical protein
MVTSAIFAPNPVAIMNCLYSVNNNSPSITRSTPAAATPNVNNRRRFNCMDPTPSNSPEESMTMINNGLVYVMVTADSKGQLKLLVNRYHR